MFSSINSVINWKNRMNEKNPPLLESWVSLQSTLQAVLCNGTRI